MLNNQVQATLTLPDLNRSARWRPVKSSLFSDASEKDPFLEFGLR
jgi:hypothetical protein